MKTWFTSDLHKSHKNILQYTDRHLVTTQEDHDQWLVDIWNSQVNPEDTVYHLGDLSFAKKPSQTLEWLSKLNGRKILIKGNHDSSDTMKEYNKAGYQTEIYLEKTIQGQHICMFHFPLTIWHRQHYNSWHLHGHSHGTFTEGKGKILDVGIDNAYNIFGKHRLFSFEDVAEYMQDRNVELQDGHTPRKGEL